MFAAVASCIWFFDVIIRSRGAAGICYGVYYVIWASAIRPEHRAEMREEVRRRRRQ